MIKPRLDSGSLWWEHFRRRSLLIPLSPLKLRPIQFHLHSHWNQLRDSPRQSVPVTPVIRKLLQWWSHRSNLTQGVQLELPPFTYRVFTDVSTGGWGAHLDNVTCQGKWTQEESRFHKNCLEMRAVKLSISHFRLPPQSHVLIATDNTTMVAYINKVGRHQILVPVERVSVCHCYSSWHFDPCQVHSWQDERPCRQPVQGWSDPAHGVVSPSRHGSPCLRHLGRTEF